MMAKAKSILARVEPVHAARKAKLTELTDKSVLLVQEESTKTKKLDGAKARLAESLSLA